MATFIDVAGLAYFSKVFVFLFVWIIVYALLIYTKVLSDNKSIAAILGLLFGLMILISETATGVILHIAPWFGVLFVFFILVAVIAGMFGADSSLPAAKGTIFVVVIVVLVIGALSYVREQTVLPGDNETSSEWDYSKTSTIIFHPTIIGAIVVLLIAVFTIALLTGVQK